MTETNSTQAEERPRRLLASEITPGLPVWARIIKKGADIPATVISATPAQNGGMLCTIELEVENPFNSQIIRQVHKKPIYSDQLTHRKLSEPAAQQAPALADSTPESDPTEEPEQPMGEGAWHKLGDADRTNRDLRYHIDEGERAFTRLAARLAEVEAYHPQLPRLKDEAASFRDRYRRVLYGESAAQATEGESPDEEQEAEQALPEEPQPEPEAAIWTRYSQGDLRRYDDQRRAWLTTWAAAHNYPTLSYRSHWRGKGYLTFFVPAGRKAWTNFLTHAWRYLAYCAFAEAYAPGQIEHYLGEAAQRGDIHLDQNAQTPMPESETDVEDQALDPARLTFYARSAMIYQGPHDQARRAWLRSFAQEHGYRDFWFTLHGQYSGYSQAGVPKTEEGWTNFLEKAVQYDVYCCFVAAYAPGQLEHLLNDAAARGAINLGSGLLWTPSNHQTPR